MKTVNQLVIEHLTDISTPDTQNLQILQASEISSQGRLYYLLGLKPLVIVGYEFSDIAADLQILEPCGNYRNQERQTEIYKVRLYFSQLEELPIFINRLTKMIGIAIGKHQTKQAA